MTKKITAGLIFVTIAVWIGWDVFVAIEPTPGDTESETLRNWGWAHPSFVFALGALHGHFFGTSKTLRRFRRRVPYSPFILAAIGVILAIADVAGILPSAHPLFAFLAGLPFGAVLWAQGAPEEVK